MPSLELDGMTAGKSFQEISEAWCVRLKSAPLKIQRLLRIDLNSHATLLICGDLANLAKVISLLIIHTLRRDADGSR